MNKDEWNDYLQKIAEKINSYSECREFFEALGKVTFQYKVTDKPEYSFYQEYTPTSLQIHLGTMQDPTVTHIMRFDIIREVFAGNINPIDATAEGNYAVEGNMAKLLKAAGLIPYIKRAHTEISKI
ncbi:MAG: SCP2 sterol-binding domain-containing protein [Candidatus Thorarchaeota archaeon]